MSVARSSSSAARPLGAAPSTGTSERESASPRTRSAVVLPAPAAPIAQTIRSGDSAASSTSTRCSSESAIAGLVEGRGQGVAVGDRGACAASVEGDPERLALEVEEARSS